jgi:hypothetical protein
MSGVRPFRAEDVPAVAALRPTAFRTSLQESPAALTAYFERVFVHLPWRDADLPSLVYENGAGRVQGFLGVVPRRMRLGDTPIRVAVPTQFMVHPESRGVAGVQLMRRFLDGPQDLSLSDRGNEGARRLWERLGGSASLLYSVFWRRPLRPARYAMVRRARTRLAEAAIAAAGPLWGLMDAAVGVLAEPAIPAYPPAGCLEPLTGAWLVEHFSAFMPPGVLQPTYEVASLQMVLQEVAAKTRLGTLRSRLVRDADGQTIGWYLYFANPRGVSQVVQLAGRPERVGDVLGHMLYEAGEDGATAVEGRLEPAFLPDLGAASCQFVREGPWMLVHSRRPELAAAVLAGRAFVSRLDSEWWLNF